MYEVERIVAYERRNEALYLKVRWVGYGPEADSWEPLNEVWGRDGDEEDGAKEVVRNFMATEIIFWADVSRRMRGNW